MRLDGFWVSARVVDRNYTWAYACVHVRALPSVFQTQTATAAAHLPTSCPAWRDPYVTGSLVDRLELTRSTGRHAFPFWNRLGPVYFLKIFLQYLSHRIFEHVYKILNIFERNNWLHSSTINNEMNLLNLISSWMDTNWQITTKTLQ